MFTFILFLRWGDVFILNMFTDCVGCYTEVQCLWRPENAVGAPGAGGTAVVSCRT